MSKVTKIIIDSQTVIRKRRIHMNQRVSLWGENFSCEGEGKFTASLFDDIVSGRDLGNGCFGVSKREERASDYHGANSMRRNVGI